MTDAEMADGINNNHGVNNTLVMPTGGPLFWQPIDQPLPPGAEWAGSIEVDDEGAWRVGLPRVRSVGLADLSQVAEYRITSAVGSVAHHVRFAQGGELHFVFNDRHQLVDLTGKGVDVSVTSEGDCVFKACPGTAA